MGAVVSRQKPPPATADVLAAMLREKEGVSEVMTSCDPVVVLSHGGIYSKTKKGKGDGEYFYHPKRVPDDIATNGAYRKSEPILGVKGPGDAVYFLERGAQGTMVLEKPSGAATKKPAGRGFVWPKYFYDADGNLPKEAIRMLRFDVVSFEAVASQPAPHDADGADEYPDDFEEFTDDEDDDEYAATDDDMDSDAESALSASHGGAFAESHRAPSALASTPSGIAGRSQPRKKVTLVVKMADTVARLKEKLQVVYLVPQHSMQLYAGATLLSDDSVVSDALGHLATTPETPSTEAAVKARIVLSLSVTNELAGDRPASTARS